MDPIIWGSFSFMERVKMRLKDCCKERTTYVNELMLDDLTFDKAKLEK